VDLPDGSGWSALQLAASLGEQNIVLQKTKDGAMNVRREPLSQMPVELQKIIYEMA